MRRRCVDDDGVRILDERDRLYRRRIGEAKEGNVAGVQRIAPCGDVSSTRAHTFDTSTTTAAGVSVPQSQALWSFCVPKPWTSTPYVPTPWTLMPLSVSVLVFSSQEL